MIDMIDTSQRSWSTHCAVGHSRVRACLPQSFFIFLHPEIWSLLMMRDFSHRLKSQSRWLFAGAKKFSNSTVNCSPAVWGIWCLWLGSIGVIIATQKSTWYRALACRKSKSIYCSSLLQFIQCLNHFLRFTALTLDLILISVFTE